MNDEVYGLGACTAFMTVVTITAWYQARQALFSGMSSTLLASVMVLVKYCSCSIAVLLVQ